MSLPPPLLCKQLLPFFSQLGNPAFEVLDKLPDGLHQAVGGSDFPVQVPIFVWIPRFSICRTAASLMDSGDNIKPLSGIRTQVHTLRTVIGFQIAVLDDLPFMPPDFAILLVVPIHRILLVAFPSAGRKFYPFPVFVKVINLAALGKPFPCSSIALIVSMTWAWGLCPGGWGSWIAKSAIMPLETNCCSQNSRTRTAYWSGGISLGMVSTHLLASWEFHCFSTASAAFHKVLRSAYTAGHLLGAESHCGQYHAFPGSASLAGHIHRTAFRRSGKQRRQPQTVAGCAEQS